jgi:hypothetical protein
MFAVLKDLRERGNSEKKRHARKRKCLPFSKRSMRHWAAVSAGRFRRHLYESRALGYLRSKAQKEIPSSMFLISTERSATSFSTTNCSLSEVTRRTIMCLDGGSEEQARDDSPIKYKVTRQRHAKSASRSATPDVLLVLFVSFPCHSFTFLYYRSARSCPCHFRLIDPSHYRLHPYRH